MTADFIVNNQGTIYLLSPISDAAKTWIEVHLPLLRVLGAHQSELQLGDALFERPHIFRLVFPERNLVF